MELNSNRLKAFYQVAIDRNFHKAAENICITQSALSQRILKLEEEIKTTLLIRGSEGIKLSDAGTILFEYVQNLNSMEQETLNLIAGHSTGKSHGSLRIAAYSSILQSAIMPALKSLIRRYPETHVEFFSRELRNLPGILKSGEADFIVSDYFMEAVNLTKIQIGEEHIVHVQNNQQLNNDLVFLDHDADDMTTYNFFNLQNIKNLNIRRNYYDDIYGIINGVKLGYGQAVVSRHLIAEIDNIRIIPHSKEVSNPVVLYYYENRYLTKLQKEVIQTLQEETAKFLEKS